MTTMFCRYHELLTCDQQAAGGSCYTYCYTVISKTAALSVGLCPSVRPSI